MDSKKRIDTIYSLLKDICANQYRSEGLITGVPTKVICEKLSIQRTNASSDLNKLFKEGKIQKLKTNPALYKVKKEDIISSSNYGKCAFDSIIGSDRSLKNAVQQAKAAIIYPPNGLHSIILGETGAGKSLFAEQMYQYAKQINKLHSDAPLVIFNCADYSNNPQLLMSHLFGVKKGAYTGAVQDKQGLVEKANNGILFLDEVHRLPPEGQEMLFYLIDKGQYRGLGESEEMHKVKVQIICATTENIESSLLKTFIRRIPMSINLPSLRERTPEERFEIIKYFFMVEVAALHSDIPVFREAMLLLLKYDCPNNIGQLRSDIKLACAKAYLKNMDNINTSVSVDTEDLSDTIRKENSNSKNISESVIKLIGEVITFSTDGSNYSIIDDPKAPNLYEMLYNKKNTLLNKGFSEKDINSIVGKDIEIYFKDYIKNIHHDSLEELYKIADKKVVKLVSDFLKYAEKVLGKTLTNKVLYGLSIHVSSFIERFYSNKTFENNHLEDIKKYHAKEFEVSKKLKESLEQTFNIEVPVDEVGFFSMFLYIDEKEAAASSTVGVLVAMHGDSAATSIADVANRLLGMANIRDIKFNYGQIKDLAILPCSYHRYYYITDDMLNDELEEYAKNQTRAEVVKKTEAELFELYKDPALDYKPEQLTKRGGTYYSDAACELISSIYNDKRTTMVVSTQNKGALDDLPYDSIAEVSSIITSNGPVPVNWGKFSSAPRGMVQIMKAMEEVTIEAAVTGNYDKAIHAFTVNPLVPSGKIAKKLLDEMLVAHKKHLPQFMESIEQIESVQ